MSAVNFIDYRLNPDYAYGFTGGPDWRTIQNPMRTTGIVRRDRKWLMPQHRYSTSYALPREEAYQELRAMTYVACGAWLAFRFKDWDDFQCTNELIGTGDGTTNPLQLVKTYVKGPRAFTRYIRLPLSPVLRDQDDNVLAVTVDPLTGLAVPDSPWPSGKGIFWTGEFDVPTFFQDDYNPITRRGPGTSTQRMVLVEEMAPLVAIEPEA